MLLNSQAVKGLPVICGMNGKRVGIISNVKYTPGKKKIDGILVQGKGNLTGSNYIPIDKIITFGQAAVIVKEDFFKIKEEKEITEQPILGKTVMRDDGHELGTISDIVFDSENGLIIGYEISKGIIDDLLEGRNLLPGNTLSNISDDMLVVSVEQSGDIKPTQGGIKNIFFNG